MHTFLILVWKQLNIFFFFFSLEEIGWLGNQTCSKKISSSKIWHTANLTTQLVRKEDNLSYCIGKDKCYTNFETCFSSIPWPLHFVFHMFIHSLYSNHTQMVTAFSITDFGVFPLLVKKLEYDLYSYPAFLIILQVYINWKFNFSTYGIYYYHSQKFSFLFLSSFNQLVMSNCILPCQHIYL